MAHHKPEVDGVMLRYGERSILSGVYLKCTTGSVVGMLGRNGCGKSSLLKIIFGSLTAESQSVRLDGKYVHRLYETENAVAYLPQRALLPSFLKVSQAVALCVRNQNHREALYRMGDLFRWKNSRVGELSGGTRRYLEVLAVLYSGARFVLLDEPFSHLSPVGVESLYPIIAEQAQTKGILITDHVYQHVLRLCTETVLIQDGRTLVVQNREQLTEWGYLPE